MGAYKENETILRAFAIVLVVLIIESIYAIAVTIYGIVTTNSYNELYRQALEKIEQDDVQIKELLIENRDLKIEYEELLKDNQKNIEYIRTKGGIIAKVIGVQSGGIEKYYFDKEVIDNFKELTQIGTENVVLKHSFNIIDLIEIEDLVSVIDGDTTAVCEVIGTEIRDKNFRKTNEIGVRYMSDEIDIIPLKRIKSIVTKEQFQAMEYEVK